MKRFIILTLSILAVCLTLSACTPNLDFSDTIESKMDELYNTILDIAKPFLKEDPSHKDSEDVLPDSNPTIPNESEGEANEG